MSMLTVQRLRRTFGDRVALDEVTFEVRPGRITGFVGGNGAGKTTTMRIILGVLEATSGGVTWDGEPLGTDVRRSIGYMPEERGLYPEMRVLDQLVFFGRLHGMSTTAATRRATDLLERLGLAERRGDVLESLSLGNQQRVQIAAALLHHPTALVLDEPFSGLDPLAVDAMVALLREELRPDLPVLFSSHQLDLVERLSDDLVILSGGRVVAAGAVTDLQQSQEAHYRVEYAPGTPAGSTVRDLAGARVLEAEGAAATLVLQAEPQGVLDSLRERGPVVEFHRVVTPLSELYREVTAR